jgi:hypothetical protein
MALSRKDQLFVAAVIRGDKPKQAYKLAYQPKTANPDSIRSLASRVMRRPDIQSAIESALNDYQNDVIKTAIWDKRASTIQRVKDIEALNDEIERQRTGIEMELSGIDQCDKKLIAMGRVMQKSVISRTIQAKQAIYQDLDESADTTKENEIPLAFHLLTMAQDSIKEDPDEYKANK